MLPDECDFCGQILDEDEDLVPIWVGEPSQPDTERVTKTADKVKSAQIPRVLGKCPSEWSALLDAIGNIDSVSVSTSPRVFEPDSWVQDTAELHADGGFSDNVNTDKSGATVTVEPSTGHDDPDLKVCEFCANNFHQSGSSE